MLQNVKLQNVMLQMNLDVNLIEYPEFSAIGKGAESPFIYDSEKKCQVVEKLTKVVLGHGVGGQEVPVRGCHDQPRIGRCHYVTGDAGH